MHPKFKARLAAKSESSAKGLLKDWCQLDLDLIPPHISEALNTLCADNSLSDKEITRLLNIKFGQILLNYIEKPDAPEIQKEPYKP